MSSTIATLAWEIWRRNRGRIWIAITLVAFAGIFNHAAPESFRSSEDARERLLTIDTMMEVASILLIFATFNYTEFNLQKEWTGFPYRLFVLPSPTWLLVALPIVLGVLSTELLYLAWVKLVFDKSELGRPVWFAVLIGAYMVFYQTILWCLAGYRLLRMLILGLAGTSFIGVAFLPYFSRYTASPWFSEKTLSSALCGTALAAFAYAWSSVAKQRCGGGRRKNWLKERVEFVLDALPRRTGDFDSANDAQFWFEWRRAGLLLPGCVAAILLFIMGPLSWVFRDDAGVTLWILGWMFAMPVILAAPIGKGYSKPDIWSGSLAIPSSQAVLPLAEGDMVAMKMKVAGLSTTISWSLVLLFLCLWLPLWANLESLAMIQVGFWMVYDHSAYLQYAIAALMLVAGMLVTWKFLVGGFWIGLSGKMKWFIAPAIGYGFAFVLALIATVTLLDDNKAVSLWLSEDPNRVLKFLEWIAAVAIIAKFWAAVFWWRDITTNRARKYLLCWIAGTACLIALALLLWAHGGLNLMLTAFFGFYPLDNIRLRNFLILVCLLLVPLARLGLAPKSLARNRHGTWDNDGDRPLNKWLVTTAFVLTGAAVFLANQGLSFSRVENDGAMLRMLKMGAGNATVVFESGAGSDLETWLRIQPAVSQFAKTISYDRAGNGLSTRGLNPRDGKHIANELHTLLHKIGAAPPYILVGHSLGGPFIRVYAGMFPNEIAGLVLADPTQEELIAWSKARDQKPVNHTLRLDDEVDCASATFREAAENPVPTNVPVFLISGQGPRIAPDFLPANLKAEVEKDQKTLYPAKLKFHREWVEKFPHGKLIVTKNSGHGVPYEEPDLVISAIRNLVERGTAATEK